MFLNGLWGHTLHYECARKNITKNKIPDPALLFFDSLCQFNFRIAFDRKLDKLLLKRNKIIAYHMHAV